MQLRQGSFSWRSVLSLVPRIQEVPSVRDFPRWWGRGGGGSSWQPAKCAVIGPWDLGGSSVRDFRDFLAVGRKRRGGPSWPPGSNLTMSLCPLTPSRMGRITCPTRWTDPHPRLPNSSHHSLGTRSPGRQLFIPSDTHFRSTRDVTPWPMKGKAKGIPFPVQVPQKHSLPSLFSSEN